MLWVFTCPRHPIQYDLNLLVYFRYRSVMNLIVSFTVNTKEARYVRAAGAGSHFVSIISHWVKVYGTIQVES
ncbi:hypothetical protein [Paenibacillus macquariensis]|nr:hypothetical protein [Paenibacillus macquariensis]MEC0090454.1 hypothetical protein [Paenibacillus macquariensis]